MSKINLDKLTRIVWVCIFFWAFLLPVSVAAQTRLEYSDVHKSKSAKPFINRWAFKTNALEWLLTIPNFGFEFDLTSSEYNRSSIGLTAKYNWHTTQKHVSYNVFDILDIRPEYRYYFRTLNNREKKGDSVLPTVKYLGAYVDYGQYSFKLSRNGIQGRTVGLGVSYGYCLPIHQYKKGALDLDLGFSVGVQVTDMDVYKTDIENNCYAEVANSSKGWHFTPFPVVSELRVSLSWRAVSVRDRYVGIDPKKQQIRLAEADIEMSFDGIREKFEAGISSRERMEYDNDPKLYRQAYIKYVINTANDLELNLKGYNVSTSTYNSFVRKINALERKALKEFDNSSKHSHK